MSQVLHCNGKSKLGKTKSTRNTSKKNLDSSKNDSLTDIFKNYKVADKPRLNGSSTREKPVVTDNKKFDSSTQCRNVPKSSTQLVNNDTFSKASVTNETDISFEVFGDVQISTKETKDPTNDFLLWSDDDIHIPEKPRLKDKNVNESGFKHDSNSVLNSFRSEVQIANSNQTTDIVDLLKENIIQFCPICLKKNAAGDTTLFVPHLKSCASRNKVSTEQLLKAVELQQKQTTERAALGLPALAQDRQGPKRAGVRKGKTDSNLELAIALSASLRESEMMAKVRETETLLEAGLEKEALSQCKQLEDFGFVASKPTEPTSLKSSGRSKVSRNTVLFTRTQAERERIITEKIAIILVDSDGQADIGPEMKVCSRDLKSSFLRNHRDINATLWNKSYQLEEHTDYDYYYVDNLSSYVSPCKLPVGAKLKHLSQIPCRPSSPGKTCIRDSSLSELAAIFSSKTVECSIPKTTAKIRTLPPVSKSKVSPDHKRPSFLKLSQDWRSLLNKRAMSDLTIYGKDEKPVFAHKLVLYARCRVILSETIKETDGEKCTEMIMWMEYSYEAIIAFLEHIYTGDLPDIKKLSEDQVADLKNLCSRYKFAEILNQIDRDNVEDGMFNETVSGRTSDAASVNISERTPAKFEGQRNSDPFQSSSQPSKFVSNAETLLAHPSQLTDAEKNLLRLQLELQTQNLPPSPVGSPEMFDSSETTSVNAIVTETIDLVDDSDGECNDRLNVSTPSARCSERSFSMKSNQSSTSKSVIEEILSGLCSPRQSPTTSPHNSSNRIVHFEGNLKSLNPSSTESTVLDSSPKNRDLVGPSAHCSFTQPNHEAVLFEKRKSSSPLHKNPVKKTKTENRSVARNLKTTFEDDYRTPVKRPKRGTQKSPLNELLAMSDSDASSNSDAPLFDLDQLEPDKSLDSDKSEPRLPKKCDSHQRDGDSSFELDDYRTSYSGDGAERLSLNEFDNDCVRNMAKEAEKLDVRESYKCLDVDKVREAGRVKSPYVSPVWDGFEEANYDFYDNYYPEKLGPVVEQRPPIVESSQTSSISKLAGFQSAPDRRSTITARSGAESNEPFFDSFSIDESILHRLEEGSKTQPPNTIKTPEVRNVTPQSVRKFKCRSKSDNVLTPSRADVTPIADYSGMKSVELKKELDKYGLKPGLSRGKAKKLLRYIYDQLHPFEDELNSNRPIHYPPTRRKGNEPQAGSSRIKSQSSDRKGDGEGSDSDSSALSSGVGVLEESFTEDDGFSQETSGSSQSRWVDLDTGFKNLIQQDKNLHRQILLYEPVWLESLKSALKENGVKCNLHQLMNYLDEKCITFRTQQQRGGRRRKKQPKKDDN